MSSGPTEQTEDYFRKQLWLIEKDKDAKLKALVLKNEMALSSIERSLNFELVATKNYYKKRRKDYHNRLQTELLQKRTKTDEDLNFIKKSKEELLARNKLFLQDQERREAIIRSKEQFLHHIKPMREYYHLNLVIQGHNIISYPYTIYNLKDTDVSEDLTMMKRILKKNKKALGSYMPAASLGPHDANPDELSSMHLFPKMHSKPHQNPNRSVSNKAGQLTSSNAMQRQHSKTTSSTQKEMDAQLEHKLAIPLNSRLHNQQQNRGDFEKKQLGKHKIHGGHRPSNQLSAADPAAATAVAPSAIKVDPYAQNINEPSGNADFTPPIFVESGHAASTPASILDNQISSNDYTAIVNAGVQKSVHQGQVEAPFMYRAPNSEMAPDAPIDGTSKLVSSASITNPSGPPPIRDLVKTGGSGSRHSKEKPFAPETQVHLKVKKETDSEDRYDVRYMERKLSYAGFLFSRGTYVLMYENQAEPYTSLNDVKSNAEIAPYDIIEITAINSNEIWIRKSDESKIKILLGQLRSGQTLLRPIEIESEISEH